MRDYVAEVKAAFPELKIKKTKLYENGWDCVVVEVNNSLMFRVPRKKRDMTNDWKLLDFLSKKALSVPGGNVISADGVITGYEKLPGEELRPKVLENLDPALKGDALNQIADFLTELHGLDIKEVEALGYQPKAPDYLFDKVRGWVDKYLPQRLSGPEMERVEKFMHEWEENIGGYTACLVHCDFSSDHILYNKEDSNIRLGFIDFSDSIIHDPAWDFAKLVDYGEKAFKHILGRYKTANNKHGIDKRARIYRERTYVWHLVDPFLDLPYLPFDFETALKDFRANMMSEKD